MNAPTPNLSVVVPCYNEEGSLDELCKRLLAVCAAHARGSFEILLVNDGSNDATWEKIRVLSKLHSAITGIDLSRNYGHQLALSAGLSLAKGNRVLLIDADLQDPPELLGEMMALMDTGADVVYGKRDEREGETPFKKTSACLFYKILRFVGSVDIPADAGDFRLLSRRAVDILNKMPERTRFLRGMISWIGLKQLPLHYDRADRFAGESHYPLRKMLALAMDAVSGFSIVPLRLASYMGFAVGIAALVMTLYAFTVWLEGETVPGWTSLTVIVLILGSAQLMSLGVFGEYLGRMYIESKQRPLYIIQDITRPQA